MIYKCLMRLWPTFMVILSLITVVYCDESLRIWNFKVYIYGARGLRSCEWTTSMDVVLMWITSILSES